MSAPAADVSTNSGQLVFCSGKEWFGVPADQAGEVVIFQKLTSIPEAPPHLLGVFGHRGEVIPVVDLAYLTFGYPSGSKRVVVVRVPNRGLVAFTANRVAGVTPVDQQPPRMAETGAKSHLRGPATLGDRAVSLIETDGLFEFLSRRGE